MPKPPKETMGGAINEVLEAQKTTLQAGSILLKTFTNTEDYKNCDEDYQLYVKDRLTLIDNHLGKIESLDSVV